MQSLKDLMSVRQLFSVPQAYECGGSIFSPKCSHKVLHACGLLPRFSVDCRPQLSSAAHLVCSHMRAVPALYSLHVLLGAHVLPV